MESNELYAANQHGERYIASINDGDFEHYGARHTFQTHYKDSLWLEDYFHIVLGSDSGLLIQHVINHGIPKNAVYLFLEPDEIPAQVLSLVAKSSIWDGKIELCSLENWNQSADNLAINKYILTGKIAFHNSIAAAKKSLSIYQPIATVIRVQLDEKMFSVNAGFTDKFLIEAAIAGITELVYPASLLTNSCEGETCLIIGAGPSLKEHIDWIKEHQKCYTIIAASRVCEYLYNNGVTPDVIITVDVQDVNFQVSKGIFSFQTDALLIHANATTPTIAAQWQGKSLYLGECFPWESDRNPENITAWGPTVANSAVITAAKFGFDTILLSGIDLCFPSDNKSHTGTSSSIAEISTTHPVETYAGSVAQTNNQMLHAAKILEQQITELSLLENANIVNLCENAKVVSGIEYTSRFDLVFKQNKKTNMASLAPSFSLPTLTQHLESILKETASITRDLDKIIKYSTNAIAFNKKIYGKSQSGQINPKALQKLNNIQHSIDNDFNHLIIVLKKIALPEFTAFLKPGDPNNWTESEQKQQTEFYYEALKSGAIQFKKLVQETIGRTKSRLMEEEKTPNFPMLIKQWKSDHQPGRATLWLLRHADVIDSFDSQQLEPIYELSNTFSREISTPLVNPDYDAVTLKNIYNAYKNNNTELLEEMIPAAELQENYEKLTLILSGLIELTSGNKSTAIENLEKVQNPDEFLLSEMLTLSMDLGAIEKSEHYLFLLSERNNQYTPSYAEILKIQGKYLESINTYTSYLTKHSDDVATWVKLGLLYRDIDENELAQTVFNYVLEIDPENTVATDFLSQSI